MLADRPIFAVADGMGGHAAGDVASAAVVDPPGRTHGGADFTDADAIDRGAPGGHRRHRTRGRRASTSGVGTTVTGAALTTAGDGAAYWAVFNVGDSRVYMFENGELTSVTVDHSVVQELVDAGAITRAGGRAAPGQQHHHAGGRLQRGADAGLLDASRPQRAAVAAVLGRADEGADRDRLRISWPRAVTASETAARSSGGGARRRRPRQRHRRGRRHPRVPQFTGRASDCPAESSTRTARSAPLSGQRIGAGPTMPAPLATAARLD